MKKKILSKVAIDHEVWECQMEYISDYGIKSQMKAFLSNADVLEIEFKNKLESEIKMACCSGAEELISGLLKDLDSLIEASRFESSQESNLEI